MVLESVWIGFAFSLGLLVRLVGLPPLVGYLLAGFGISLSGDALGLPEYQGLVLKHIAHIGVLLLLFSVGLKLNLRAVVKEEVIGPGLIHFLLSSVLYSFGINFFLELSLETSVLLGIALSFSSTVLSSKVLEGKRELQAFHGRVTLGILILQDLLALVVMAVSNNAVPSPYALLVFLLPLARPIFYKLLDHTGKDELFVLLGVLLSLVVGGFAFEQVGLSSELGALALGLVISKHKKATELSRSLWSIKEFFLIGFFLQIGIEGLPTQKDWLFALAVNLTLVLKGALFFILLIVFKLRARSAFLSALSLTAFSEFGLIVASVALPQYMIPLALSVTISFIISAPLNTAAHSLYEKIYKKILPFERNTRHPDEQIINLGDTQVLIMGLGRTGRAAYNKVIELGNKRIAGLDSNPYKVEQFKEEMGMNVYYGDAEDIFFWEKLQLGKVTTVLLCLPELETKLEAIKRLRSRGFGGYIGTHCADEWEAKVLGEAGADRSYLTLTEAGVSLAKCAYAVEGDEY